MSDIKVVNSGPDTIKVTVNETPKVNVSVPDNSVIEVTPGITDAERNKLAGIDAGATADQVLTGGTNISLSESSGDYTINLDNSIDLSGTLDVSGDATLDSNLTVDGDITVSDSISAIFQTESASDNINVGAQTVKFNRSTGGSIQATSSNADISLKSLSGDASIKGKDVTIQIGDDASSRVFKVFDENNSFNQDRFVVDGKGTTTLYQAIQGSTEKLFEVKTSTSPPYALEHVQIGTDSGGYKLPATDGSANTFLQTNGSGTVTFVAPTISDLSDGSNVTTLDGTQTITGNKTFSGATVLNLLASNGAVINGSASATSLSVSGTASVNSLEATTSIQAQSLTLISQSNSASEIVTVESGLTPSDLHLKSNGNVKLFLDQDNNESGQKFIVANNAGTEKFSVQEDGTVTVYGKIVSASNGDIDIEPNGDGDVLLGNFKFDADQSVGDAQDDFVLTYNKDTGKISLEAATGSGSGSSTFLGLTDTPPAFTASKFLKVNSDGDAIEFVDGSVSGASSLNDLSDVTTSSVALRDILVAGSSGNFENSSLFNDIYTLLKLGTSTTLTDGANTNSEMELTGTTAKLKTGVTELKLTETSPGDIEFVVATDSTGSTPFTAVHLDGLGTANDAQFIVKNGCQLVCEGTGGAQGRITYSGSGNAGLALPTSSGTIALTSDIASDSAVTANTAKTSFPGFGTSAGTALEGDTALLQLGTTSTTALAGDTTTISASQASAITANTAKNSYPNADASKLSGIETGADVTDATNVAAAGALMAASAQLTGNLDTQANEINTTTSNGNVKVAANGTGVLEVRGNTGGGSDDNPGAIKLNCAENTHGITIKSPPHANEASYTLTLPDNDGDANQVLQTDGSGNLSWVAQTGGSGGGMTETPLGSISGRAVFSSSDDNESVVLGGSFGISNYYQHNEELGDYDSSAVIDSTTYSQSPYKHVNTAILLPSDSKKVRAKITYRIDDAEIGQTWGFSMWSANNPSGTSSYNMTLRGRSTDTTPTSTSGIYTYNKEFTTTSAITDDAIYFVIDHRTGSISSTTYIYFNLTLFLVD